MFLEVQSIKIELESYRRQLDASRTQLTEVIPDLPKVSQIPPESNLIPLTTFLEVNDCSQVKYNPRDVDMCYKFTRAMLIKTTKDLDTEAANYWAARRTVDQLVENINTVIDGYKGSEVLKK